MIDREKIISALENCSDPAGKCRDCPYEECERFEKSVSEYPDELIRKAVELLKEQEPRVLTLDELRALYDTDHFVWVEDNGDDDCFDGYAEVDVYKENVELFQFGNEVQWEPDNDNYGKTWRCWSSRPTDEQREAVPWQD